MNDGAGRAWGKAGLMAAAVACVLAVIPVPASPHDAGLEIEAAYTAVFRDGRLTGFQADWRFDELFSLAMLNDFDRDSDGALDAGEIARLSSASLPVLRKSGFFTHAAIGNQRLTLDAVGPLQATVEDGRVRYRFLLGVSGEPVELRSRKLAAVLFDPTKAATLVPAAGELPLALGEGAPPACQGWADELSNDKVHGGRVTVLYLACTGEGPRAGATGNEVR